MRAHSRSLSLSLVYLSRITSLLVQICDAIVFLLRHTSSPLSRSVRPLIPVCIHPPTTITHLGSDGTIELALKLQQSREDERLSFPSSCRTTAAFCGNRDATVDTLRWWWCCSVRHSQRSVFTSSTSRTRTRCNRTFLFGGRVQEHSVADRISAASHHLFHLAVDALQSQYL